MTWWVVPTLNERSIFMTRLFFWGRSIFLNRLFSWWYYCILGRETVLGSAIMRDEQYLPSMLLEMVDPYALIFILTRTWSWRVSERWLTVYLEKRTCKALVVKLMSLYGGIFKRWTLLDPFPKNIPPRRTLIIFSNKVKYLFMSLQWDQENSLFS